MPCSAQRDVQQRPRDRQALPAAEDLLEVSFMEPGLSRFLWEAVEASTELDCTCLELSLHTTFFAGLFSSLEYSEITRLGSVGFAQ